MRDIKDINDEIQERKKHQTFWKWWSIVLISGSTFQAIDKQDSFWFLIGLLGGIFIYFLSYGQSKEIERLESEIRERNE
jgi:hypothetical protein